MNAKNLLTLALLATTAATLAGCGGGSSTPPDTGSYVPNPAPTPAPTYPTNSGRVTVTSDYAGAPAQSVTVAVLDSGINSQHQEFTDNGGKNGVGGAIVSGGINTVNAYDNAYPTLPQTSGNLDTTNYQWNSSQYSNESYHGNFVASIIAGAHTGYSGDASLYIEKITGYGTASANVIDFGFSDAANNGAQFANLSFGYDPISEYQQTANYENSVNGYQGTVRNATDADWVSWQNTISHGLGMVVSAGNNSLNFSTSHATAAGWNVNNPLYKQVLIVGALSSDNSTLASYSNYAGDDPNVQARFITAVGTNTGADPSTNTKYGQFMGTSSAAPIVTAAAATLKSYWSFMTPAQVEQRLLDTADKNFNSLWNQNNCGTSGALNCGSYYYGSGRLDLNAAMQPAGVVVTTTAASVPTSASAQSAPAAATGISVPASLAPVAASVKAASVGVQGFDAIGRNYTLNLAPSVSTFADPTQTVSYKMTGFAAKFMQSGQPFKTLDQ
ncbi:hypothetical protein A9404_04015 [Halothiobacillus diazotrophicus]|uniref:Peptidase S8/S53 domain-containing protein n=1 Tax=Halothiobacillus diazotrophicus TaxID=1860122 RepID=A0A191ZFK8_9GAMM|nr:S8 family serine peptidase [Halothiobacillus diazotrophicus]ANJ66653.1 hypothetical protein A9404_04015 [Halothiobacillus diazotrophicus]